VPGNVFRTTVFLYSEIASLLEIILSCLLKVPLIHKIYEINIYIYITYIFALYINTFASYSIFYEKPIKEKGVDIKIPQFLLAMHSVCQCKRE